MGRQARPERDARLRVNLVQETTSILLRKYTSEAPWLILQRLHVLDIHEENVARLGSLDLKRAGEIVHAGEIDVSDIVRRIVVLDLATRPVDALDLHSLSILDRATGWDVWVPAVLGMY